MLAFQVTGKSASAAEESVINAKLIQEKTFQTSDGTRIHYLEAGQRDNTILFVPGWLMPAEIFQKQLEYFANDYHVISFSPRSQGKSDIYLGDQLALKRATDIKELLQFLNIRRFILVGWSLGVMESLDYVRRFGTDGLQGIVLIDNSIGEGSPPKSTIPPLQDPSTEKFTQFAKGFSRSIFKLEPPSNLLQSVELSTLKLAKNPTAAYKILHKPYPREYYRETIYSSKLPVWYAITPRYENQAVLFKEKYPLGEYTIYAKDAGHALFVDQSERFNQDMLKFLRTLK